MSEAVLRKRSLFRKKRLRPAAALAAFVCAVCACSSAGTGNSTGTSVSTVIGITEPVSPSGSIDPETFSVIDAIISSDIENGFPAAQLAVMLDGEPVYEKAWGSVRSLEPDGTPVSGSIPVTTNTLFDLASVTKMFSVNYALQKMVTDGTVDPEATLVSVFGDAFATQSVSYDHSGIDDETMAEWKAGITLRDLLSHQGGFPPDPRSFRQYMETAMQPHTKQDMKDALFRIPLTYEPGTKTSYSDVDYMLLGLAIEELTGTSLDTWLHDTFFAPMALTHIAYNPLENGFSENEIAATELNGNTRDGYVTHTGIRTSTLQGEVHDENAFHAMGGVSGHAGLFANARDLATLANLMLDGTYGDTRYFSADVIDLFTAPKNARDAEWGLGWWRAANGERDWFFGTRSPSAAFGHQGWTGTNVIIDPETKLVVVLLTNRIHSRITDPEKNLERFDGNWYTTATPGWLCDLLRTGMQPSSLSGGEDPVTERLIEWYTDMTVSAFAGVPEDAGKDSSHPAVRNVKSKLEACKKIADLTGNPQYQQMEEALVKAWEQYLPGSEDAFRRDDTVVNADARFEEYLPLLENRSVALFTNHTGIVYGEDDTGTHILDALLERDVDVRMVFAPEHGIRGDLDAGALVEDTTDDATGVPVISLYGNSRLSSLRTEDGTLAEGSFMEDFDTLVVDIQDVGVRFYTYYLTMLDLMNACASFGKQVIILDRANPNGFYVDGPVLREPFRSGVGRLPLPLVHGMTLGELARMINGEGWLDTGADSLDLTVIPCEHYTHSMTPSLPVAPSPNLKDMRAVYLYPSTALFENSAVSVGRGTDEPFVVFGSPYLADTEGYDDSFTPASVPGAANPPFLGETCFGLRLRSLSAEELRAGFVNLSYLVDAFRSVKEKHPDVSFFGLPDGQGYYWIDYLCGTDRVRIMLEEGKSASEIRADWMEDVALFKKRRAPYLLYPE